MIAIVIIEPTSEFLTSVCTWPLRGSNYQKLALATTTKAAPQMMKNISKALLLRGTNVFLCATSVSSAQIF
jgi:hypothetical protein